MSVQNGAGKGKSFPLMFRSTKGSVCGGLIYGGCGTLSRDAFWTGKCIGTLRKYPGHQAKANRE